VLLSHFIGLPQPAFAFCSEVTNLPRGARVWQIAFGSGFKCNSAVLVANRAVTDMHPAWDTFDKAKMYAQLDEIVNQLQLVLQGLLQVLL